MQAQDELCNRQQQEMQELQQKLNGVATARRDAEVCCTAATISTSTCCMVCSCTKAVTANSSTKHPGYRARCHKQLKRLTSA